MTPRRPVHSGARAFSLVEATLATLFVGVLLAGTAKLVSSFAKTTHVLNERAKGQAAAEMLLSEILRSRYAEPDDSSGWGLDEDELDGVSREEYDDLDDYDGLASSPPCARDGSQLDGYAGWTASAEVKYVSPANVEVVSATDTKLIRVVVTVTSPNGKTTTLRALRSAASTSDLVPTSPTTYVTWVNISLKTGTQSQAAQRGTQVLNRVVAN